MNAFNPILRQLKAMPLFAGMFDEHLGLLSQLVKPMSFKSRAIIFEEGDDVDDVDGLYFIVRGRVEISTCTSGSESDDVDGQIVHLLYDGDFFGEYGLITGKERNACATAALDTEVLRLSKSNYFYYRQHRQEFTLALHDVLFAGMSQRQVHANVMMLLRKISPVRRRLMKFLLLMARPSNESIHAAVIDHLNYSQVAVMLGVERRAIGRGLKELENQRLIERKEHQPKHILIPCMRQLEYVYEQEKGESEGSIREREVGSGG